MPSNHKSSFRKLKKELNSSLNEENRKTATEKGRKEIGTTSTMQTSSSGTSNDHLILDSDLKNYTSPISQAAEHTKQHTVDVGEDTTNEVSATRLNRKHDLRFSTNWIADNGIFNHLSGNPMPSVSDVNLGNFGCFCFYDALPKTNLDKFNGDTTKRSDWCSQFNFLIIETPISNALSI